MSDLIMRHGSSEHVCVYVYVCMFMCEAEVGAKVLALAPDIPFMLGS